VNRRTECLETAERLVNHDRNSAYDEPSADFRKTAAAWSIYKGVEFDMHDVAAMMILLKLSRISHDPTNADSWIDVAGYAACGYDVRPE
jgi:hypothetical protein